MTSSPAPVIPFPAPSVPPRARSRGRYLWIAALVLLVTLLGGAAVLALSFLPGHGVRTLRRAALRAEPATWDRQIEFGVGRIPTWIARTALRPVDLPPEARAALEALRSADVGIYHRRSDAPSSRPDETLAQVRDAMENDGWQPAVLVRDGTDTVAVFVPNRPNASDTTLSAAVFVMNRDDLVVVSARADLMPLIDALPAGGPLRLPLSLAHR